MGVVKGVWYLVYRYRWEGQDLVRDPNPIDGVLANNANHAIQIAASRNDIKDGRFNGAGLNAVFCTTVASRMAASDLSDRHTCDWWSQKEFVEWMLQPGNC